MPLNAPFRLSGNLSREPTAAGFFGMRPADQLVTACTKFILANQAHKRKLKIFAGAPQRPNDGEI
jgi:hypothetical protein